MRILRDPNVIDPSGNQNIAPVTPAPVVPVVPQNDVLPKSKEDWAKLESENPTRWKQLTQERMDATIRQNREQAEKLAKAEQERANLLAEIERFKKPVEPIVPVESGEKYKDGTFPQTEDEWNELFLERPAFATDLRNEFLNKRKSIENEYQEVFTKSQKIVQAEHQDMYIPELDDSGKPKVDEKGKLVLKLDPVTKEPIFNRDSEKGKLWEQIFNENPQGWLSFKNAPALMMAEMERRLRAKGSQVVSGHSNATLADQTGLAPRGVTPPKVTNYAFATDEERKWAEASVARGTFKSLEEYGEHMQRMGKGWVEPNRTPDFSKR